MESSKDINDHAEPGKINTKIIGRMIVFIKSHKTSAFVNFFNEKNSELNKIAGLLESFRDKIENEKLTITTESPLYLELITALKKLDPDNDEAKFLVLQSQFALIHSKYIDLDVEYNKYKTDKNYTEKIIYANLIENFPRLSKEILTEINREEDILTKDDLELRNFYKIFEEYEENQDPNIYEKLKTFMRKVSQFKPQYELTNNFKKQIEDTMVIKHISLEISQENNNNAQFSEFGNKHKPGSRHK